jgi:DNA-binding PadR family transcriptional regulator
MLLEVSSSFEASSWTMLKHACFEKGISENSLHTLLRYARAMGLITRRVDGRNTLYEITETGLAVLKALNNGGGAEQH